MIKLVDWCFANNKQSLLAEWDYDNNADLRPDSISYGSSRKVWWKCKKGHRWEASVDSRTRGTGCPYCSGRNAIIGENDLLSIYPEIAKEWHPTKNGDLIPSIITAYSSKKVWWLCDKGHEWLTAVSQRTKRGDGCPYCSGHKVLPGYNDLKSTFPLIASEWHPTKNGELTPSDVSAGSHKKAWWKCSKGHEWQAIINSRTNGCGCPDCGRIKRIKSYYRVKIINEGSLLEACPLVANEWHPTKNGLLKPTEFTPGSGKKVWWKCSKGHEWQAAIYDRVKGIGCPYCSNRRVIPGFNDLGTINPRLASEWNYEKNKGLVDGNSRDISTPDKVTAISGQSVWWKCSKGHEWQAKISNRTNGNGCPLCSSAGTSVPEQGISFYLEQICRVEQRKQILGKEIDVYLPEYRIGIEYDGVYYHNSENVHKEIEKNRTLIESGIVLIRIKEANLNEVVKEIPMIIKYSFDNMGKNYTWAIAELCRQLKLLTGNSMFESLDIDAKRDLIRIRERTDLYIKENNIAIQFPELVKEWDFGNNGILLPEMFTFGSDAVVWWKCSKGHEWRASISHRTNRGDGCPVCSEKRTIKGINDFETWCITNNHFDLLSEWDYGKNEESPSSYSRQSTKRVWWKCSRGHTWQTSVGHRTNGHGCPYCNGGGAKRVVNVDTGEVFDSMIEAAQAYGMKRSNPISKCCLGEQKTAGGYHWKYADE